MDGLHLITMKSFAEKYKMEYSDVRLAAKAAKLTPIGRENRAGLYEEEVLVEAVQLHRERIFNKHEELIRKIQSDMEYIFLIASRRSEMDEVVSEMLQRQAGKIGGSSEASKSDKRQLYCDRCGRAIEGMKVELIIKFNLPDQIKINRNDICNDCIKEIWHCYRNTDAKREEVLTVEDRGI